MALAINTKAPDFSLPSTSGSDFKMSHDWTTQLGIIYFYPKDFTPICTIEACQFRDTFDFFKGLNVEVIGISQDDIETHLRFKEAHHLPFELLADPKGEVARLYHAYDELIEYTQRITYLIDGDYTIKAVYDNIVEAEKGIKDMIQSLQKNIKTI